MKCYKEAFQAIVADKTPSGGRWSESEKLHRARKDEWDKRLATVFNRGFWDGYYQGQRLGEWNKSYGSCATERKQLVGRVTKYFSRIGVAEVSVDASTFQVGDRLFISGPTTGALWVDVRVRIHGNEAADPTDVAQQHQLAAIRVPEKVRPNDKLFKIVKEKIWRDKQNE